jgi:GAF domain-containing protein
LHPYPDMEPTNGGTASLRDRELDVAREVAHAFITASSPLEVYRLALARLTPLVRAKFSSVFHRDPADPTLLKLTCAHNWPQSSARYLGQLRVREGRGPTGRAVAESRSIEVRDVFADPPCASGGSRRVSSGSCPSSRCRCARETIRRER